ncbi:recombinase family protein [Ethanoligenens sp.]|uniref:recombinase family protein n=1 Tax=Ethanoligenens sp. TaxID=2099655 RepID=UPI0039E92D2D
MGIYQTSSYNAAIYCRLSKDDEQAGESVSIQTQRMMLEKYCQDQGFPIYGVYADDGYSGLNFDRPDFQRLLTDIDDGKINLVITKDLSRLGRDYIQTGYYTDIYFSRKKVRYIAVNDGVDTNKDDNDIAPFKNILNDMYAKDLSRKVKSAKRQRAYSGYYISAQPPYGYKVNPINRNQLIVDDEPAAVVKDMFRLALAGNSTILITKILTERKVLVPALYKAQNGDTRFERYNNGKDGDDIFRWCNVTVQQILKNRVYTGDMENHKFEVANYKTKERVKVPKDRRIIVENTHEAIVSHEDFDRVQELVRMRHKPKQHNFDNVFKSLVFCADCGSRMTFEIKSRKYRKREILTCRYHFRYPEKCPHYNYIYYQNLYDTVLECIQRVAQGIESGDLIRRIRSQAMKQSKRDKLEAERAKIQKRLGALGKITRKLYEDYACDLLDTDSYHKMLNDYQQEQKQLTGRSGVIQNELDKKDEYAENLQKLSEVIGAYLDVETLTANMLNQLIERIEIGHPVKADGTTQQEINIIYRFVGTTL